MAETILHICTTIDGFIADENGNSDFVFASQKADKAFKDFYASVGSVVMGRKTYDYLKDKEPDLFKDKEVFVITHYLRQKENNVTFVHEDIMGSVMNLKKNSNKNVWILGGSEIVNILLKENMLDKAILTTAPIILGTGIRLFKNDNPRIEMKLIETKTFDGFVQTHYEF